MKLTILGSGTTVPSARRSAPAYLLEIEDKKILIDSGEGTKRRIVEAEKDPRTIDYFIYTHTHVDHVAELPALLWGFNWQVPPRTKELIIYGPQGFKKFFKKMLAAFWPQFAKSAKYTVNVVEIGKEESILGGARVSAMYLEKVGNTLVKNSVGYRISSGGKTFVFTGDIGYTKKVIQLARGADLLLIEAAVPKPMKGHLTPRQAGKLAAKAGAKKVAITHFYPQVEEINILEEAKKEFNGEIILAKDLMEIEI